MKCPVNEIVKEIKLRCRHLPVNGIVKAIKLVQNKVQTFDRHKVNAYTYTILLLIGYTLYLM